MFRIFKIFMVGAQAATIAMTQATMNQVRAQILQIEANASGSIALQQQAKQMVAHTEIQKTMIATQMASNMMIFAGLALISKSNESYHKLGYLLLFVAGAMMAVAMANMVMRESTQTKKVM